jgi:hypothetical protein
VWKNTGVESYVAESGKVACRHAFKVTGRSGAAYAATKSEIRISIRRGGRNKKGN